MMAPYWVLLLWEKFYRHVLVLPEKRGDTPRRNGSCRQNLHAIARRHHRHCERTLTHQKFKNTEHRLFMFEPMMSHIPGFD